jgi:hypothetical protein
MRMIEGVLNKQYEELHSAYMKAHNEHAKTRMELEKFIFEISRLVKWSKGSGVIYLSYGGDNYEVYTNKDKKGNKTFKVMKAKRVICENYYSNMDSLRFDIVFNKLVKK